MIPVTRKRDRPLPLQESLHEAREIMQLLTVATRDYAPVSFAKPVQVDRFAEPVMSQYSSAHSCRLAVVGTQQTAETFMTLDGAGAAF